MNQENITQLFAFFGTGVLLFSLLAVFAKRAQDKMVLKYRENCRELTEWYSGPGKYYVPSYGMDSIPMRPASNETELELDAKRMALRHSRHSLRLRSAPRFSFRLQSS